MKSVLLTLLSLYFRIDYLVMNSLSLLIYRGGYQLNNLRLLNICFSSFGLREKETNGRIYRERETYIQTYIQIGYRQTGSVCVCVCVCVCVSVCVYVCVI